MLLGFTLRGFHFCLYCCVLCAASEVVKGQLDLPSPLAGSAALLVQLNYFASCSEISPSPWHIPSTPCTFCFQTAPKSSNAPHRGSASSARGLWGEQGCISSSEQVTGRGQNLLAAHVQPPTWTPQQCKPILSCLPAKGCSA